MYLYREFAFTSASLDCLSDHSSDCLFVAGLPDLGRLIRDLSLRLRPGYCFLIVDSDLAHVCTLSLSCGLPFVSLDFDWFNPKS